MTAIRAHQERRLLLDFSSGKYSKNKIKQSLRQCNIVSMKQDEDNEYTIYDNEIKVGMYTIRLHLPFDCSKNWNKLRDYGDFVISICEGSSRKSINLNEDARFRYRYWTQFNSFGKLRIKHLIDIIAHCKRLDNLKAFL